MTFNSVASQNISPLQFVPTTLPTGNVPVGKRFHLPNVVRVPDVPSTQLSAHVPPSAANIRMSSKDFSKMTDASCAVSCRALNPENENGLKSEVKLRTSNSPENENGLKSEVKLRTSNSPVAVSASESFSKLHKAAVYVLTNRVNMIGMNLGASAIIATVTLVAKCVMRPLLFLEEKTTGRAHKFGPALCVNAGLKCVTLNTLQLVNHSSRSMLRPRMLTTGFKENIIGYATGKIVYEDVVIQRARSMAAISGKV